MVVIFIQCAIISPVFQVREFKIEDMLPFPVKFTWDSLNAPSDNRDMQAFPAYSPIPSTKLLTFYRREPTFDLEASYSDVNMLPSGTSPLLGHFSVRGIPVDVSGSTSTVKVKARLNPNGILEIQGAQAFEEKVVSATEATATPPATKEGSPENAAASTNSNATDEVKMDGENHSTPANVSTTTAKDDSNSTKKSNTKKVTKKTDLEVISTTASLSAAKLQSLKEAELEMAANDKLIFDTEERKNALEAYVYDMRNKLETTHATLLADAEKETYMGSLTDIENWLYDDGENATKSVYASKLESLEKVGGPVIVRYREAEERPAAIQRLRTAISDTLKLSASSVCTTRVH